MKLLITFSSVNVAVLRCLYFLPYMQKSDEYDDQFISFIYQQAKEAKEAKVKHEKKQSKYHDDSRE